MDLITKSKALHELGYKWMIMPESYVVYFGDNEIANKRRPFNPIMSKVQIQKELERNLREVHKICNEHNSTK